MIEYFIFMTIPSPDNQFEPLTAPGEINRPAPIALTFSVCCDKFP